MQELKTLIEQGNRVIYTLIRHRTKCSMSISCHYIINGKMEDISDMVAKVMKRNLNKGGVVFNDDHERYMTCWIEHILSMRLECPLKHIEL